MPIIRSSSLSRRKLLRLARLLSLLASQSTYTADGSALAMLFLPKQHHDALALQKPSPDDDRLIKLLLKQYKKLELALSKFSSKHNSVTKANLLRTVLLPFLRLHPPLESTFLPSLKLYASFCSVSTSILGKWWRLLLLALGSQNQTSPVSALDRNAYLECISRIMALREWVSADSEALAVFSSCLADTLDFCVRRVQSLKIVPISMCAFVGKVFAYAFFNLPHVCNALLFLLNVKQALVLALVSYCEEPSTSEVADAKAAFPKHLSHLIAFKGLDNVPKAKQGVINSIPPPSHPVKGIRDPSGVWVRKWSCSDSDIFNSFFRHYISLADMFLANANRNREVLPAVLPGFYIIATHVYQVFEYSINRIVHNMRNPEIPAGTVPPVSAQSPSKPSSPPRTNKLPASPATAGPVPQLSNSYPFKSNDTNYTCISKILKTTRDISFSSIPFANNLTRFIDSMFVNIARSTSIYDCNRNGLILSLVHVHSTHVFDTSNIDWDFWLGCVYLMLSETHHLQITQRSMAFLFNVWDRIPDQLCKVEVPQSILYLKGWLRDPLESIKMNFSNWLTSTEVWMKFFLHWNPIVRSYFLRLLVWRVIGINNYESSSSIQTTRRSKVKLDGMFDALKQKKNLLTPELNLSPDSPMVNRKFGILPLNPALTYLGPDDIATSYLTGNATRTSDLRKTHPYEVFDEAIYSCTSLPSSPAQQNGKISPAMTPLGKAQKNGSLINSLSKFFKGLSTEDKGSNMGLQPPQTFAERKPPTHMKRNSRSFSSLTSSPRIPSRNSSPSLASHRSVSTDSSVTSDSESSMSDFIASSSSSFSSRSSKHTQPPELLKVPPEIVRPIFKFDIIIDNEVLAHKFTQMQKANASDISGKFYMQGQNYLPSSLPKAVKVPSVSVFLNSDIYNPFYISTDNYLIDEEIFDEGEENEKKHFVKEITHWCTNKASLQCLGKAINEWNLIVEEFERFLFHTIEADQANYMATMSSIPGEDVEGSPKKKEINEEEYFQRLVPFLPIDSFTELKLLNAS